MPEHKLLIFLDHGGELTARQYRCETRSTDAFLAQLTRLVSSGHYFYFLCTLKDGKDPSKLDEKLIRLWNLDKPAWKREARRRGRSPNIHYLRFRRTYLLISTHGTSQDGKPHPFFTEYQPQDITRKGLSVFAYQVRYPYSKTAGKRRLFVRLNKDTYEGLRSEMLNKAVWPRYEQRETMEAEFRRLPFQLYKPVQMQIRIIAKEVNRVRRYAGFEPVRLTRLPNRMRPLTAVFSDEHARTKVSEVMPRRAK